MNTTQYDKIIIGAGIFGLYAALKAAEQGQKVCVLEYDQSAFERATFINQARVHNGYHYPRSFSTAIRSAEYYRRFCEDFDFAINHQFKKIYAIAREYSWTSAEQFIKFCQSSHIDCLSIPPEKFFVPGFVEAAFETREYAFDAQMIKQYFLKKISGFKGVEVLYGVRIETVDKNIGEFTINLKTGQRLSAPFVLNATYASTNQVSALFGFDGFAIKYELCEIILCKVSDQLKDQGVTLMDGPFFSIMPFGKQNIHSLTAVPYTPHKTSYTRLPQLDCQHGVECSKEQLQNCNICINKPETAWPYMHALARKFLADDITLSYSESLFAIKAILKASEIDDSRPTLIRQFHKNPDFYAVLSGKVNTIYDLNDIIDAE